MIFPDSDLLAQDILGNAFFNACVDEVKKDLQRDLMGDCDQTTIKAKEQLKGIEKVFKKLNKFAKRDEIKRSSEKRSLKMGANKQRISQ